MHDFLLGVQIVGQFALQLLAVAIQHAQIQWAKVIEEILIDELIVDGEVMCVGGIAWFDVFLERNEIQTIWMTGNTKHNVLIN